MTHSQGRRRFLQGSSAAVATGVWAPGLKAAPVPGPAALPEPTAARLPRWRGFNLIEKQIAQGVNVPYREEDFAWMAEWGFNFARLQLSYLCWSSVGDWRQLREPALVQIDQALAWGRQYGVHVSLSFHRAPGYSVDRSVQERFNLWTDPEALEACVYHWRHFAARYRHLPNTALSFDLINEPGMVDDTRYIDDALYVRVARALVDAIRAESPQRLIIANGLEWGRIPVPALADLGIAQSTRGYDPMRLSHWQSDWIADSYDWPRPDWPQAPSPEQSFKDLQQLDYLRSKIRGNASLDDAGQDVARALPWGRERIIGQLIEPWKKLESQGVGVHVGEFGAHSRTPHDVTLAWMADLLAAWKEAGWGWALWNLRGSFGVVDSHRADVQYERFRGQSLDRKMLELLRSTQ